MRYTLRHDTSRMTDLDPELARIADRVHVALAGVAAQHWVPAVEVELVWTREFVATVQDVLDAAHPGDGTGLGYDVERLGGQAVAKNIPMNEDSSRVAVVVNCNVLGMVPDELMVSSIFLLAHELTHPLINRTRAASGVLEGVQFPSHTPTECARSIARTSIDEYWTDRVASIVLGATGFVGDGGERVPLHQGHLHGGVAGYRHQLTQVLDSHVHPGWPNLVEAYREHRISLEMMWGRLVTETDQIINLLAHGQACEDGGRADTETLIDETVASNRGFSLYIDSMWTQILAAVKHMPIAASRDEFIADDLAVADAGEAAIRAMWEIMGITIEEYEDRTFYLHVKAPTR